MHVLITGASSGIGKGIAEEMARRYPAIHLYLIGRDFDRLQETTKNCKLSGASVKQFYVDITDYNKLADFFNRIDSLDIVFANAGISAGTAGGLEDIEQVKSIFETNVLGTINTIYLAQKFMIEKNIKGKILVTSSIAGMLPLASCPAYTTSKAAISHYCNAIRPLLKENNIDLKIIVPGFVKTAMTAVNTFRMPFLIFAEQAAKIIVDNLNSSRNVIYFPKKTYYITWLLSKLPNCVWDFINRFLPRKQSISESKIKEESIEDETDIL